MEEDVCLLCAFSRGMACAVLFFLLSCFLPIGFVAGCVRWACARRYLAHRANATGFVNWCFGGEFERPTFNIERPTSNLDFIRCWIFKVRCWTFEEMKYVV